LSAPSFRAFNVAVSPAIILDAASLCFRLSPMENYPLAYQESVENLDFTFEQVGDDFRTARFDARPEGDPVAAFTFEVKHRIPTLTVQLTRESDWRSLYPELKGPDMCLMHFGPNNDMGRFAYGIIAEQYMSKFLRRPNHNSSSIYFTAQNDREYKWKVSGPILECIDTHAKKKRRSVRHSISTAANEDPRRGRAHLHRTLRHMVPLSNRKAM